MWVLDHKEGWVPRNWCLHIVVLEKTLESPLDSKEIKVINPKGNQPWRDWKDWCWSSNTLATWCEELTHWKKILMLGKIEGKRMRWLESITDSMDVNLMQLWETVEDRGTWCAAVHEDARSQVWLDNWTTTWIVYISSYCAKCYFLHMQNGHFNS